jgi:hypothetical protein
VHKGKLIGRVGAIPPTRGLSGAPIAIGCGDVYREIGIATGSKAVGSLEYPPGIVTFRTLMPG